MFQTQRFNQFISRLLRVLPPKRLRADLLLRRGILYAVLTILVVAGYALPHPVKDVSHDAIQGKLE